MLCLNTFLHLHPNLIRVSINRTLLSAFLSVALLSTGCSSNKNLVSVLVEDKAGNTELIYRKSQSPSNLVKEIKYYPSGDTLSITPMNKGVVDGMLTRFHKNNKLKEQVTFQNGAQNGPYKRYDKEGVLVFEGQLSNGQKTGKWITWYDDVQIEEERQYKNDQPDGKWSYYFIDGSLKREEVYNAGKLIEEKNFN